jgi:hypothetical protein
MVLEFICAQFGHEADAASFLLLVEQDADAFFSDFGEGEFELEPAIAAQGVEDVSCEALGVDADQGRGGMDVTDDEGYEAFDVFAVLGGFFAAGAGLGQVTLEAEDSEVSPAGGEVGVGYLYDSFKTHSLFYGLW